MCRKRCSILAVLLLVAMIGGCVYPGAGAPAIITFEALPPNISSGQSATLVWAVNGADAVTIEPGIGQVALTGSRQVSPGETVTYTLTASSGGGSITRSVVINVSPNMAILNFNASPSSITAGGASTLSWQVTGASIVTITPGIGSVALSGSRSVSPSGTTTYTLTAQAGSQQVTATTVVTVNEPPIIARFSVFPESIQYGSTALLRWSVTGASRIQIQPGVGNVPASGNHAVTPTSTTTYVLTAESDCCVVSDSVVVRVADIFYPPPGIPTVVLFNIEPNSIYRGDSATLQWNVSEADTVHIDHGIGEVANTGSIIVSPTNNTVYTLTATNAYGYRKVSVGIVVFEPGSPSAGNPVINFNAQHLGGTSWQLSWSVSNAMQIVIEPDIGTVNPTGDTVVHVPSGQTKTYKLTATNNWGWAYRWVTLQSP